MTPATTESAKADATHRDSVASEGGDSAAPKPAPAKSRTAVPESGPVTWDDRDERRKWEGFSSSPPGRRPSVSLTCPDSFNARPGDERLTFGYRYRYWGEDDAFTLHMDYGDGDEYTATDEAGVKKDLFWHVYEQPGNYVATATITDAYGRTRRDSCSFSWTVVVPQAPRVSVGGHAGSVGAACTYDDIPLWGTVQVVDYAADLTVQLVDYGADLRVQPVSYGASSCGQWQFVDYGADFTVQFVDYAADITVQEVTYGPGM